MRVSLRECRILYERAFNKPLPDTLPYVKAANMAIEEKGMDWVEEQIKELRKENQQ